MKVNRIQWDRFKLTWDTVKVSTAITFADRHMGEMDIVQDQETGEITFEPEIKKTLLQQDIEFLELELLDLEEQGRKYIDKEDYLLVQELYEIWLQTKKELDQKR